VRSYVDAKQFMGSVLVARDRKVLLSKGYGSANLEWDIPNSPSAKFRLGSVTKQFTAACILLLEERGKLRVEDPVKKYMLDAPAAWDKVTIFNLLTHTSVAAQPNCRDHREGAAQNSRLSASSRDQDRSMATFLTTTSFAGRSWRLRGTAVIFFTTSCPSTTSPKIVCLPVSQSVGPTVMKNCEPLVFGPALAMASLPGLSNLCGDPLVSSSNW